MPRFRTLRASLLMILLIALVLTACGKSEDKPKATQVPPAAVTFISVTPQIYLAGYFGAVSQGYFDEENLQASAVYTDSTLDRADSDVLAQVVAGDGQFGMVSADRILQAREEGQPVVAIASVYQRDPTAVIALKNKGITRPEDLVGKKLLIWTYETMFRLFASAVGLDMNQITFVTPPDGDIASGTTMWITNQVDAMVANGTDTAVQLSAIGIDYDIIYFNEYGVANYPNVLFTTEAMLRENPAVVQRFVNAFVRGMQYAVRNPEEMAAWFMENYGETLLPQQQGSQAQVMQAIIPLIAPPDSQPGMMNAETWQLIYDEMVKADLLEPMDVSRAYTTTYVDAHYK
ncbi:MAG: ABC transporter substrate-binding protein [Anaerolineae bacterium]|nr:ABC transporter substrate-binding protein [Anaerolineae bacterium]